LYSSYVLLLSAGHHGIRASYVRNLAGFWQVVCYVLICTVIYFWSVCLSCLA